MKKMNLKRLCWLLLVLPLQMIRAEDLPKPFTFARYQTMSDRSPFAVATSVAPPETANFAKDLYIANAAHSKEGDFVTIASSTDRNFKKYLTTTMLVDGYGISNIDWSDKVGATKVTVTKDGQSATLSFNEALLKGPPGAGQNPAQAQAAPPGKAPEGKDANPATASQAVAVPPGPATQQTVTKPMPVPVLPTPAPRTRGVIPRNPNAPNPGGAAVKPSVQTPPH